MNGIRNFILDNIRYVISGILLVFIVITLVKCTGEKAPDKETLPEKDDVVASEDEQPDVPEEPVNDLKENAYPAVNTLVLEYFKAKASGDVEALKKTVSVLSEDEADSVTKMAELIENYNNIICYSKTGPEENSYVVYVSYDIKFVNVETMAPSLTLLYVCSAADGSLFINNGEWDAQSEAVISGFNEGEDVKALLSKIESKYTEALEQDEKLRNLASTIQSASQETDEQEPEETPDEQGQTAAESEETVYAKSTVNIRSQASETADRVGQIAKGSSAVRLSEENGWSKIKHNNATAYVKSEYLTTNKADIPADEPAADAPSSGAAQITETAKMRAGESTSSDLIETLYPGSRVTIVEHRAGGRSKITYNGKTGYVNTECLGPIG